MPIFYAVIFQIESIIARLKTSEVWREAFLNTLNESRRGEPLPALPVLRVVEGSEAEGCSPTWQHPIPSVTWPRVGVPSNAARGLAPRGRATQHHL